MTTIRKITDCDIRSAFGTGRTWPLVQRFRESWRAMLGEFFVCPGRNQIVTWCRICGWDWELLAASIADLASRAVSAPALSSYDDPFLYGIRYYSASLIRRTRQKYGRVRPPRQQVAA
jgi:hypothetical protein